MTFKRDLHAFLLLNQTNKVKYEQYSKCFIPSVKLEVSTSDFYIKDIYYF